MKHPFGFLAAAILSYAVAPLVAQDLKSIDIAYEKRVLENGLTVIVHEDTSSPTAFVIVYYKVGSRDEEPGKTGFAHLFEHLMFNGTENFDEDYFKAVQEVGGNLNGDTWFDRTRYYQTVPSTAVDRVLWLESERMGHFLGALTQEKLDNQRGVVQNEKLRGDNRPYAMARYRVLKQLFPEGHPYSWATIGSIEDLNAASLDDVHAWFRKYYGAANAIITIAGDVDAEEVFASVEAHFGDIPAGPPVSRVDDMIPVRTHVTTDVMEDRVPNIQIQRHWVGPGRDHEESAALGFAARVLGGDDTSRLFKALVRESGLATDVRFGIQAADLATMASLTVTLANGTDLDEVTAIIDSVLGEFAAEGPGDDELDLFKISYASSVVRGLEGIGGKAVKLAEADFYLGDPELYRTEHAWVENVTPEGVKTATRNWLGDNYHQIVIKPYGDPAVIASNVDRSQLPAVTEFPAAKAPYVSDFQLSNGINVRFVEKAGVPALHVKAVFNVGRIAEERTESGVLEFVLELMDKGSDRLSADDVAGELKRTGSSFSYGFNKTSSTFSLSTLSSMADPAIALFSRILRSPSYAEPEFQVAYAQKLAHLESDKATPSGIIGLYLDEILYGNSHPYGMREHGLPEVIAELTADDVREFHRKWFLPENMMLFAGGDISQSELRSVLDQHFGEWQSTAEPANQVPVPIDRQLSPSKVIFFDTPGAAQSNIVAVQQLSAPFGDNHEALLLANHIYGGSFLSRINMNIREEKGWSYGVRSSISTDVGPRKWNMTAQVQTDRTAESLAEILRELDAVFGDAPFTEEEVAAARDESIRSLAMALSSTNAVLGYLIDVHAHDRPDNEIELRGGRLGRVTVESALAAIDAEVDRDSLIWIIAGDLEMIEENVRALDLGPVEVWDADGNVIR